MLVLRMFSVGLLLLAGTPAWADASLMGKEQLVKALKDGPPCCVIDARTEKNRQRVPLADSLPYRQGMKISPTAAVIVVADDDRKAMGIARNFATAYPGKTIIAAQGGQPVWSEVLADQASGNVPEGGISFVIPRNTCEHGTPLQKLLQTKP